MSLGFSRDNFTLNGENYVIKYTYERFILPRQTNGVNTTILAKQRFDLALSKS